MLKRAILLATCVVASISLATGKVPPAKVSYQPVSGPYFGLMAGYGYLGNIKNQDIDDHSGAELGVIGGYQISRWLGVEYQMRSLPQTRRRTGETMRDNIAHVLAVTGDWQFAHRYALLGQLGMSYIRSWAYGKFVPYAGIGVSYAIDTANRFRFTTSITTASGKAPSTFNGLLSFVHTFTWWL